jgi:hypothetical protein
VVVKVPRFAFEKFPSADSTLTTHMKSVGEAMAIGRNFTEALGKALRSLEDSKAPFEFTAEINDSVDELLRRAAGRTMADSMWSCRLSARAQHRSRFIRRPRSIRGSSINYC